MQMMILCVFAIFASSLQAADLRVYEQDPIGNIQYHKPSYLVQKDGRIIEANALGEKEYHKQQYNIRDGVAYPIDRIGNIQHHKPALKIELRK